MGGACLHSKGRGEGVDWICGEWGGGGGRGEGGRRDMCVWERKQTAIIEGREGRGASAEEAPRMGRGTKSRWSRLWGARRSQREGGGGAAAAQGDGDDPGGARWGWVGVCAGRVSGNCVWRATIARLYLHGSQWGGRGG